MGYEPGIWEPIVFYVVPGLLQGLAIFAAVYFGMSLALKRWSKTHTSPAGTSVTASAEEIMRERYARGEISRSEYERMREDLG